jgi:polyisoprenoid-binding protein YceI
MKQLSILVLGLFFCFTSFAQETWIIDNPHSNVRFEVGWEDFSMRTGEFKLFEGSIETSSRYDLSDAVIEFKVDASSVDVIAERLAEHVKSDKFLNVEKYPEITYSANNAIRTSDTTFVSKGKLSILGVEKEQDVLIEVKGSKETRRGYIYGLEVTLQVNRMDFGLDWGSPRLGESIKIVGYLLYKMKAEEE